MALKWMTIVQRTSISTCLTAGLDGQQHKHALSSHSITKTCARKCGVGTRVCHTLPVGLQACMESEGASPFSPPSLMKGHEQRAQAAKWRSR
eukprot:1099587-Pelagomonas_calceolata.AAC.4